MAWEIQSQSSQSLYCLYLTRENNQLCPCPIQFLSTSALSSWHDGQGGSYLNHHAYRNSKIGYAEYTQWINVNVRCCTFVTFLVYSIFFYHKLCSSSNIEYTWEIFYSRIIDSRLFLCWFLLIFISGIIMGS